MAVPVEAVALPPPDAVAQMVGPMMEAAAVGSRLARRGEQDEARQRREGDRETFHGLSSRDGEGRPHGSDPMPDPTARRGLSGRRCRPPSRATAHSPVRADGGRPPVAVPQAHLCCPAPIRSRRDRQSCQGRPDMPGRPAWISLAVDIRARCTGGRHAEGVGTAGAEGAILVPALRAPRRAADAATGQAGPACRLRTLAGGLGAVRRRSARPGIRRCPAS